MKQQKMNIAFKQDSNQSLEIYGNWLVSEGNEGILIVSANPASLQDCLQERFKSKSERITRVKIQNKRVK